MAKREIFNIKAVRAMKHSHIEMGDFKELLGEVEGKFTAIFYGPAGGGKSVYTLQFCEHLANTWGKVLYDSHEEGTSKTIQDRIINFDIKSDRLYLTRGLSFDKVLEKIQKNYYRVLVIDSIQYAEFTPAQLKQLRERFSKRLLAIIMVSFGTKNNPSCHKDLFHAADIKAFFCNGKVEVASRYNNRITVKTLYKPQAAQVALGGLFNQGGINE